MACPDSGPIKISDLVSEFGGSAPHALTEYYRNGGEVPGNNTNVPTSGQISLTNFYSAVNEIQHTHSNNDTHANYATIFGSNWSTAVPKRVIVPSGVTVGGTSTHAMTVPSGMGGTLVFDISGNVHGHGGASNGGTGGNAIHCIQTSGVTINLASSGSIKAGGGGGGQGGSGGTGGNGGTGGTGGQGRYGAHGSTRYFKTSPNSSNINCNALAACRGIYGQNCFAGSFGMWGGAAPPSNWTGGWANAVDYGEGYWGHTYSVSCLSWAYQSGGSGGAGGNSGGAGGAGGAGGVGQGYNQSNASGSSGAAGAAGGAGSAGTAGTNNAGTGGTGGSRGQGGQGGTGGTGGTFGNSGGTGGTGSTGSGGATGNSGANGNYGNGSGGSGGSSGGAAGYYIYNRASITFNHASGGTVAGQ